MFGVVDKEGKLTGKDVVYVYPDEKSYLKGQFEVWQNSRGVCVCVWGGILKGSCVQRFSAPSEKCRKTQMFSLIQK